MASWNSTFLEVTYQVLGWIAFFSWSFSFYPQVVLNYNRKGLGFAPFRRGIELRFLAAEPDETFVVPNLQRRAFLQHGNRRQYHEEYGYNEAYMNFNRKSTLGWSIGNILLDLTGGLLNFGQMAMQSIDQNSLVNFYGNIGKTLLSLEVVFFDLLFILQHYVFYPVSKEEGNQAISQQAIAPLIDSSEHPKETV
ncbi:hypothetical protein HPP92_024238 [Vanilla planifolia]|uniref:Cystinosin n=1 Tax=Vanilla planifolia TaxID=51239 RepID=A0A835UD33_VANPL|nr:hypothetical protein HPP92_024238 [Vanilla planifolia]